MGRESEAQPPTWLDETCPLWCARPHRETDLREDRLHVTEGIVLPVIVGRLTRDLRVESEAGELVVTMTRHLGDATTWLLVREAEGHETQLLLTLEGADQLRHTLQGLVTKTRQ